jgi:hypothetical protein
MSQIVLIGPMIGMRRIEEPRAVRTHWRKGTNAGPSVGDVNHGDHRRAD